MSVLAAPEHAPAEPLLTVAQWQAMMREPIRDHGYLLTRSGPAVAEFKSFKRMSGLADSTLDYYERALARMVAMFPAKTLAEFTSEDLLLSIDSHPPRSQRKIRAAHAEFWKWAYIWGKVEHNPMLRVPTMRRPQPKLIDIFTDEEEERMGALRQLRDRAPMLILLGAGLRRTEARKLQLGDVDLDTARIAVYQGKGSKDRLVPVGQEVVRTVAELAVLDGLNDRDHLWYGTGSNGSYERHLRRKTISQATFYRWWERCLREARVEYRNPHTTRHTYATKYLRAGGRLERLSRILGHSSTAITESLYAHLVVSDLEEDLALVLRARGRE